jgi:hypothetical protein
MILQLAEIDRAFFEAIRTRLILMGYLPDRTVENTPQKLSVAKKNITDLGKEIIEVFGTANYADRQKVTNNKIVIHRLGMIAGDIGAWGVHQYRPTNIGFDKTKLPAQCYKVNYQIAYLTNSTKYDRILTQLFLDIFGIKGNLYGIKDDGTKTDNYFDFIQTDYQDLSEDKYIEKAFRYTVQNVFIMDINAYTENIAKIQEIVTTATSDSELNPNIQSE